MLEATDEERQDIVDYLAGQAPDEKIKLIQKVYSEHLHSIKHDIWDVHTNRGRWWVITNPTNLYSQKMFPDMDLALTFHVGLCLRIPSTKRRALKDLWIEPLIGCWRSLEQAQEAFKQADEVEAFQAVGMRCREALRSLVQQGQAVVEIPASETPPKKADFREWSVKIADTVLAGDTNRERRSLLKSSADAAWRYTNWLTHARNVTNADAEAALESTELVLSLFTATLIRCVRGVPERCPACGSYRLSPERGLRTDQPGAAYERPTCTICGWVGSPVTVSTPPSPPRKRKPKGDCIIPTVPLTGEPPPKPTHIHSGRVRRRGLDREPRRSRRALPPSDSAAHFPDAASSPVPTPRSAGR
jgi:hypothetical protein